MAPAELTTAIPLLRSAAEFARYQTAVEPYLFQFLPFPQAVWDAGTNPTALKQVYLETNPFISAIVFSLFLTPIFLIAAEVNRNYSQIDRFWSILPTVYNAHYVIWAHLTGLSTSRLDLLLAASTIWSTRLTYNYWRRGGYQIGSEDYRWPIIKAYIGDVAFFILNVLFIALGQNLIFVVVTSPTYLLLLKCRLDTANGNSAIQLIDGVFGALILALISLTWAADQQQWNYQTAKYKYRETAKIPTGSGFTVSELERGFRTTGLFAWSRHPNFAAEQAVWWTLYFWGCVVTQTLVNWTVIGPIAYSLVFQGSTPITEYITAKKYPEYREYQRQVGVFLPKFGAKAPVFENATPKKQRKIMDGSSPEAAAKNAADYAQAKKRYNLR